MQPQLTGLRTRPAWFSYLGALGGCLDYLGLDISTPWLYGGTGLAFMMNMASNVDVGSPIAWDGLCANACQPTNPGMALRLGPNLGCRTRDVCACPYGEQRDVDSARKRAWDLVRESIAEGLPCIGYELDYPEFFPITGYTDAGYFYRTPVGTPDGPDREAGPKPWAEVGRGVQWIRFQAVLPGTSAPDDVIVREALRTVVARMSEPPAEGGFVLGLTGYDLWANALEQGTASGFGHRYCAATYAELRTNAVGFLQEAKRRVPGLAEGLLDEAIAHYQASADSLAAAHALHPFMDVQGELIQSDEAAALIRAAGAAETKGLPLLAAIAGERDRP